MENLNNDENLKFEMIHIKSSNSFNSKDFVDSSENLSSLQILVFDCLKKIFSIKL